MSNLASVSFRIDRDLKAQAESLFKELGLNMTTAFNIFLKQSVREGKIPFDVSLHTPNAETIAALVESKELLSNPNTIKYDVEEALRELKK